MFTDNEGCLLICPDCNDKFFSTDAYVLEENRYLLSINNTGLHWGESELIDGTERNVDIECPNCGSKFYNGKRDDEKIETTLAKLKYKEDS